jgi:hypothetical protein
MAKVPLLKSILISAGETLPEGLDADEVTVISPDDLDPETMVELQQLAASEVTPEDMEAGDADDASEDEPPTDDEPIEEPLADHDEAGEGLDEELAETPEMQAAEDAAGAEMHQGPELKTMVADKAAGLESMLAKAERIADSIPDAKKPAKACEKAIEQAQKLAEKIADMDDDKADKIREMAEDFQSAYAEAEEAFEEVKSLMPSLDDEPEADDAEGGGDDGDDAGGVGAWAKRVAGGEGGE